MGARVRKLGCQSFHQQAADELGGDNLFGADEEGVGGWGGGEVGGYGSGLVRRC